MARIKGIDRLANALQRSIRDLLASGVEHALVGGLAVGARTEPRFTRDIDLAVAVRNDKEAEAVIHNLLRLGYQVEAVLEQTASGRLATARLCHCEDAEVLVDLLFASCGIEFEVVDRAEALIVLGTKLKVASLGHLIAMKVLSVGVDRDQDRIDLRRLIALASQSDLRACPESFAAHCETRVSARQTPRGKT